MWGMRVADIETCFRSADAACSTGQWPEAWWVAKAYFRWCGFMCYGRNKKHQVRPAASEGVVPSALQTLAPCGICLTSLFCRNKYLAQVPPNLHSTLVVLWTPFSTVSASCLRFHFLRNIDAGPICKGRPNIRSVLLRIQFCRLLQQPFQK